MFFKKQNQKNKIIEDDSKSPSESPYESPSEDDFILLENVIFNDLDDFEEFMNRGDLSGKKLKIINFQIENYYFESQDIYNLVCVSTARKFKDRWRKYGGINDPLPRKPPPK